MLKGQISIDFMLAVLVALIFIAFFQTMSTEIAAAQTKMSIRSQEKDIANSLAQVIATSAVMRDSNVIWSDYNFAVTHKIPYLLVPGKDEPQTCDINVYQSGLSIGYYYDGAGGEDITYSVGYFKPLDVWPVDDAGILKDNLKCGETIVIKAAEPPSPYPTTWSVRWSKSSEQNNDFNGSIEIIGAGEAIIRATLGDIDELYVQGGNIIFYDDNTAGLQGFDFEIRGGYFVFELDATGINAPTHYREGPNFPPYTLGSNTIHQLEFRHPEVFGCIPENRDISIPNYCYPIVSRDADSQLFSMNPSLRLLVLWRTS